MLELKRFLTIKKNMKAVGIMKHGGPEALEILDVPEVDAGPGQIRIRNYAAAVNPIGVFM